MTDYEAIKFDICCAARLLHRQGLSVANADHLSVAVGPDEMLVNHFGPSFAALRAKAEIARIPVLPLLWQDFLKRLRATDPDLFEGREN